MKKVLFLDIDGVLNSHIFEMKKDLDKRHIPYRSEIDPETIEYLNFLIKEEPSLEIVISSSWRDELHIDDIREYLEDAGLTPHKITGTTQEGISKAEAIDNYVKSIFIDRYCIIDDDWLFDLKSPHQKYFIKTAFHEGLKPKHLDLILNLLK